jgi:hypothetical protein
MAECERCGRWFRPRRAGHVYCSASCRRTAPPPGVTAADPDAVERLFDESRDPDAVVRDDDWFHGGPEEWRHLFACDTVATRRRWFLALRREGRA